MVVTLYTDGAGKNPTSSVCDTSFAVVLLEDLSNHCISSLAHDARLSGVAPPVFSVFRTGKTRGRQTVSRAELSAAIVAIGSFRNLRLVTDSMYVINTIAAVQADPRPSRWVNRPNFDLVLRLLTLILGLDQSRSIKSKVIRMMVGMCELFRTLNSLTSGGIILLMRQLEPTLRRPCLCETQRRLLSVSGNATGGWSCQVWPKLFVLSQLLEQMTILVRQGVKRLMPSLSRLRYE